MSESILGTGGGPQVVFEREGTLDDTGAGTLVDVESIGNYGAIQTGVGDHTRNVVALVRPSISDEAYSPGTNVIADGVELASSNVYIWGANYVLTVLTWHHGNSEWTIGVGITDTSASQMTLKAELVELT